MAASCHGVIKVPVSAGHSTPASFHAHLHTSLIALDGYHITVTHTHSHTHTHIHIHIHTFTHTHTYTHTYTHTHTHTYTLLYT